MPGLVAFNRRWQIGGDDLVLPGSASIFIRLLWLIGLSLAFGYHNEDFNSCSNGTLLDVFFIGEIVILILTIMVECAVVHTSAQGTISNVEPRKHLAIMLYIRTVLYMPEFAWSFMGTVWAFDSSSDCQSHVNWAVRICVLIQWAVLTFVVVCAACFFDPLGAKRVLARQSSHEHQTHVVQLWETRCRHICCCVGLDERHLEAYSDIAKLFGVMFNDVDAVPSDIAAGLILLQQQQEKAQNVSSFLTSAQGTPLDFEAQSVKEEFDDISYFMKFALGCYGWPLYTLMNSCSGFCVLLTNSRCCCMRVDSGINVHVDDHCCEWNTVSLRHQLRNNHSIELLYVSFHNKLYEVPFSVAVDHDRKSVVIAIRGTLSLQDTLTDMTAEQEKIKVEGVEDFFCHKGMLQCAIYIRDTVSSLGILHSAFSEHQNFKLVIVGHSLGAGTASILSVLLRPHFPQLVCYAYSPPGVFSLNGSKYSQQFIVSVILGKDVVPRLSIHNVESLKKDLIKIVRRCTKPKYQVLVGGALGVLCSCWSLFRKSSGAGVYNRDGYDVDSIFTGNVTEPLLDNETIALNDQHFSGYNTAEEEINDDVSSYGHVPVETAEPMYPPGRIIHLIEEETSNNHPMYHALWSSPEQFQTFVISHKMFTDHMPDAVAKALQHINRDSIMVI